MQCLSCGASVPEGNRFCTTCGKPMQTASPALCRSCGQPVKPGLMFCTSCGTPVGQSAAPPPSAPAYAQPLPAAQQYAKKGASQALFWVPFGLLLVVGLLFFALGNVGLVGWVVLVALFGLMVPLRGPLLGAGAVATLGSWVGVLVVLFLTLGITAPSKDGGSTASSASTPGATPASAAAVAPTLPPAPTTMAAGAPTKAPAPSGPTAQSIAAQPTQTRVAPTAVPASSPSGARVENIAVGLATDQQARIVNPATSFPPDTPEISLSYEVRNVSRETTVEVHWIYLGTGDTIKQPPQKIAEDRRLSGSLSKPTKGFPPGEFKVVVLLDGKETGSINFLVPGQTSAIPTNLKVQNLASGTGLDQTQKVLNPSKQFKPNTPEICFSMEVLDVPQNTTAEIQLTYVPTGDKVSGPAQTLKPAPGVSRVGFAFSVPTNGWPAGQYRATLLLDTRLAGTIEFSVQP